MRKTVYLSDFHLTDEASYKVDPGCFPYNKVSTAQIQNTAAFLTWVGQRPHEFERVVLLGDILDTWAVPNKNVPPVVDEVRQASQNQPIFKVLNLLPKAGIEVVYVPGNHDDQVSTPFTDGMVIKWNGYRNGTILACHGHENSLFNAPDPKWLHPLGYYITRAAATSTWRTGKNFPSEASMLIKNRDEVLKIPRQGLVKTIWNVVAETAKLANNDMFVGSGKTVDDVRAMYADLYNYDHGNADKIAAEFDPYYSMFANDARLCICGHSHTHVFSSLSDHYMLYINVGAWCYESESYFAVTWDEDKATFGALYRWAGNSARKVNAACVPK